MKLSQLTPGQRATVSGFKQLDSIVRKKLMVMGILPNTEIRLIRRAPMGDPLQVEVRGVSIALRNAIAESIEVTL
ncbi:FeoA family protein [Vibrio agarivorans]|uniref:FeoA family protein n=1 Tax=Vibrio agarivorans TaxID=153622 RepID=UPI0022309997|nr:FeoA family protein [Vibrio agarivorans]MDN3662848.1 FeoA family protein [Vibrio agarivorans]